MVKIKAGNKKIAKNKYKDILSIVKVEVDKLDPIGLLHQGCPKDEYENEIHRITSIVNTCNDYRELQELIYNVFKESFGTETAGGKSLYFDAAKNILEKIQK